MEQELKALGFFQNVLALDFAIWGSFSLQVFLINHIF